MKNIEVIESEGLRSGLQLEKQNKTKQPNFISKWCICSTAMPLRVHALFNLLLYAPQLDISPSLYFILLFSPRLTPPDFSFFCPPFPDDFHVILCGALQVSSKTFPEAEKRNFPILPESLLILAEEQPRELSNDDSHRERADKPVWLCL